MTNYCCRRTPGDEGGLNGYPDRLALWSKATEALVA